MSSESEVLPPSLNRFEGRFATLLVISILAICFIVPEIIRKNTEIYPIIGGGIGAVSSLFVMVSHLSSPNKSGSTMVLLFWRAFGDFGLAVRFLATNGFNLMVCGALDCSIQNNLSSQSNCGFASFMLQFFEMASEGWFLCSGLDLYFSITQPFSNFKSRLPYYHLLVWTFAFVYSIPTIIDNRIFGYWYINESVTDTAFCWLQVSSTDANGSISYVPFLMLYIPLVVIFTICSAILVKAYLRLRQGIPLTVIHRMKILIANSINISICMSYWAVILACYGGAYLAWYNYENTLASLLFQGALYVLSSKGVTSILVYITIMNIKLSSNEPSYVSNPSNLSRISTNNMDRRHSSSATATEKLNNTDERLDLNNALRQEILHFATTGIRCSAKESESIKSNQSTTNIRISQDSTPTVSNRNQTNNGSLNIDGTTIHNNLTNNEHDQITLWFFIRLVFGFRREVMAINNMVLNTSRNYSIGSTVHIIKRQSVEPNPSSLSSSRLSQRITVLARDPNLSGSFKESNSGIALSSAVSSTSNDIGVRSSLAVINLDDQPTNNNVADNSRVDSIVYEKSDDNQNPTIFSNIKANIDWLIGRNQNIDSVEFTEYEPYYFRRIRLAAGVTDDDYIDAFKTTIKERLNDGGASGAFFFFSKDEVFLAKSCNESELDCLRSSARSFASYLESNNDSFICRIYGAYRLRIYNTSLHFFVMHNIFLNKERAVINEKYDIKGSWIARNATPPRDGQIVNCKNCEQKFIYHRNYNRKARTVSKVSSPSTIGSELGSSLVGTLSSLFRIRGSSNTTKSNQTQPNVESDSQENKCPFTVNRNHEPNITLKDNDLKYKIRLTQTTAFNLLNQLKKDAEFLYSIGVMDFSLLVGVHNTEYEVVPEDESTVRIITSIDDYKSKSDRKPSLNNPIKISNSSFIDDYDRNDVITTNDDGEQVQLTTSPLHIAKVQRLKSIKGSLTPTKSAYSPTSVDSKDTQRAQTRRLQVSRVVAPEAYYLGIIDYQQKWNFKKKLERFFKIHFKGADPDGLSAIEPSIYKDRFIKHIEDIIDLDDAHKELSRHNTIENIA
mmetsp:Transcript_1142/g.998  ORF Transcript_1142/g.998 Transcript_1142/m.998 type:complete len:1070 (-) Transcript_1142:43-3252(-)